MEHTSSDIDIKSFDQSQLLYQACFKKVKMKGCASSHLRTGFFRLHPLTKTNHPNKFYHDAKYWLQCVHKLAGRTHTFERTSFNKHCPFTNANHFV